MNIEEYFNITVTQGQFLKTKIKATDALVCIRQIIVMEGDFTDKAYFTRKFGNKTAIIQEVTVPNTIITRLVSDFVKLNKEVDNDIVNWFKYCIISNLPEDADILH